jgi:hypothetical protein
MNARQVLGDAGLAVLLALPTATLVPTAVWQSRPTVSAPHVELASADRPFGQSRFSLPG